MKKVFLAVVAMVGMLTSCGTQTDAVRVKYMETTLSMSIR